METSTETHLKREFRARDAFAFGIAFLSPIAALYSVFGLILSSAGPRGWWAFVIVLALQLILAAALGIAVSRWPIEGGSWQWAGRLVGPRFGWAAGWIYLWALIINVSTVTYFIAGLIPTVLGIPPLTTAGQVGVSVLVMVLVVLFNIQGPRVLKAAMRGILFIELIGSGVLTAVLLIWHHNQPISVIFDAGGLGGDNYLWGAFFFAVGVAGYTFAGFESACSLSEEIHDPARHLPRVMIWVVLTLGAVVLISSLALIMAAPSVSLLMKSPDPAAAVITAVFGEAWGRPFLVVILFAFIAAVVTSQNASARVLWAMARNNWIPGSQFLVKLHGKHNYPVRALIGAGVLSIVAIASAFSDELYVTLVSTATSGFFIAMAAITVSLAVRIIRREFTFGVTNYRGWTLPIVLVGAGWSIFEVINLNWPRSADQPWYVTFAVPVGLAIITALGLLVWFTKARRVVASNPDSVLATTEPAPDTEDYSEAPDRSAELRPDLS